MINLDFRLLPENKKVQKNEIYKVNKSCTVDFVEEHDNHKEVVKLVFALDDQQYGIYANEYRRPGINKRGCKTTDVLSCVVDDANKKVYTLIFDVKVISLRLVMIC